MWKEYNLPPINLISLSYCGNPHYKKLICIYCRKSTISIHEVNCPHCRMKSSLCEY